MSLFRKFFGSSEESSKEDNLSEFNSLNELLKIEGISYLNNNSPTIIDKASNILYNKGHKL